MANEVNANIQIGIDSSQALASLKTLQNQISSFNKSVIASNAAAVAAQKSAVAGLASQIGATKQFSTSIVNVESSVSRLGKSIDRNKLSLGEYFKYGVASSKNFGSIFKKEHIEMTALAEARVKRLQTQYIALGAAQSGVTKAMAVRPLNLYNADLAIATQRQQLFSKLLSDGSTSLINFGKNTQWAGRQLMVGFTVPLTIFGGMAGKVFMDLEKQIVNFKRVYGDATTPLEETNGMIEQVKDLAKEFTKYGIAVKDTVGLASDAAAAGAAGEDLLGQTAAATRLSTLGMIDQQQALTATIALQSAFKLSSDELANSVNFLNAVENQTVLSLDDVTVAIPKVATVIQGLGGNVEDLSIFLAAMREGGVNAAEGANALKSGLASLINPTKAARDQLEAVGINIDAIISSNKGDIRATVMEFGNALGTLDKFSRQQTLAKVFGKYQFARLGALFENISRDGSQAQRVIDLTGESIEGLAELADKELGAIEESIGVKFTASIERLKLAIAPIGEVFLKVATPFIDLATKILGKFDELSPGVKQFMAVMLAGVGVVVPTVIMLIGLFGNFIGQAIKGFSVFNNFFNRLRGGGKDLQHLSDEQLDAAAAASSLEGKTSSLTNELNVQRAAVVQLARSYRNYVTAAGAAAAGLPQGFRGAPKSAPPGFNKGGLVPGSGNEDTVLAFLTPGESVITKEATKKFGPMLQAMNDGSIPGFKEGVINLGGEQFALDFSSTTGDKSSILTIQRMFDNISEDAVEVRNAFKQMIRDITQQQVQNQENMLLSATRLKEIARQSEMPEIRSLGSERKYNASSAGERRSIPLQIQQDLGVSPEVAAREYARSQNIAREASTEISRYYDEQINALDINDSKRQGLQEKRDKSVSSAMQVDRAHMVALTNQQKTEKEAWNARMWTPQSGVENQLSNMLVTSQSNQEVYRQYLSELGDDVASEQQKATILRKITSNLALTESELQIQKVVLDGILADSAALARTSEKFAPFARATSVAASSRARTPSEIGEDVYATSYETGQSAVRGVADGAQTASNSRATIRTGEFVAGGLEEGIRRGTSDAVRAARDLRKKVDKEVSKPSIGRRSASRPAGPASMSTQEIEALLSAERRAARKERGPVVREGTLSPISFRPGEESSRIQNIDNARSMAMQEEVNRSHALAIVENEKLTKQTSQVSKEMSKTKGYVKKFGGSLLNGSMKMQGAMFALDGVIFGASMMDNSLGQLAQKILPAVFAFQGLTMALPLLANPIGLAVVAIGATVAGFWMLNKSYDDLREKSKNLSKAMFGATVNLKETAEFFNRKSFTGQAETISARREGVTEEELTQAQEYMTTDAGKKLIDDLRMVLDNLGSEDAAKALQNNLQRLILDGAVTPQQAQALAINLGKEIGNTKIGIDASLNIKELIGLDGKISSFDERLKMVADITGDMTSLEDSFKNSGILWDGAAWYTQVFMILKGEGTVDLFAEGAAAEQASKLQVIQTEIDRLTVKLAEGTISIDTYRENMAKLIEQRGDVSFESSVNEAEFLYGEDFDKGARDKLAQGFADSLISGVSGLGQKAASKFIGDFNKEINLINTQTGNLTERSTNILDPESVKEELDIFDNALKVKKNYLENAIRDEEEARRSGDSQEQDRAMKSLIQYQKDIRMMEEARQKLIDLQNASLTLGAKIESGAIDISTIEKLIDLGKSGVDIAVLLDAQYPDAESEANFLAALKLFDANYLDLAIRLSQEGGTEFEWAKLGEYIEYALRGEPFGIDFELRANSVGETSSKELIRDLEEFDKLANNKKTKTSRIVSYAEDNFGFVKNNLDDWDSLSDEERKLRVMAYVEYYAEVEAGLFDSMQDAIAGMGQAAFNATYGGPGASAETARNNYLQEQINKKFGLTQKEDKTDDTVKGEKKKGSSGGGTTKSWLQQLIDDTKANLALFPKMLNQLKGMGIPQQIIEMIGGGEEGVKKAQELLGASKEKLKQLIKDFNKNLINEAIKGAQQERDKKNTENMATGILMGEGLSREDAASIASDPAKAQALLAASTDKTGESTRKLVKSYKELLAVPEYLDPVKNKLDEINNMYKAQMLPLQEKIDKQQEIVDNIQEEIDALQELNDSDQDKIRNLERQKEMIQRQIDDYERLNELDERRVQTLQRQDELRNRESESLSRELEALSDVEKKIRESYQERIDALDKVSEVNSHILEQQKQQLGLSQALSEGDIYAATAAAQQMRQTDAQFAQQQVRSGLEQGMENAVEGLRTSGGLTREQAEEQIKKIKEQSYQTSLLIRDIEDAIYARNQLMVPLKDQQLTIDRQIRDITDTIYNRESQIIVIQNSKLKPAADVLDNYTKQAAELKKNLDVQANLLEGADLLSDMTEEQIKAAGALGSTWHEVAKQIKQAREFADGKKGELIKPERSGYKNEKLYKAALRKYNESIRDIDREEQDQVNVAVASGQAALNKNMGGKIMKYAKGSIVGTGAMDSVPAMLTPGEYVIRKAMVDKYGTPMFDAINQGAYSMPRFNTSAGPEAKVSGSKQGGANIVAPMYNNYSVNVSVSGSNSTADEIANKTIMKIKQMQETKIRSGRGY